ncbi:MAG: hypothetical protein ACKO0N_16320 [Planctomycetota bacterium]
MKTLFHVVLCIGVLSVFALGQPLLLPAQEEAPSRITREEIDRDFQEQLQQLMKWCDEQGLKQERSETARTLFSRDPQRQYIFLPSGPVRKLPENLAESWRKQLEEQREKYAESLFDFARQELFGTLRGASSYQLLHEVLYWNPDHAAAREALGHRRGEDGWLAFSERLKVRAAPKVHPELNWPAGSYQLVTTENFEIASQADEATTRMLAEKLQRWHWVWRQVCFDYWSNQEAVRSWIEGKSKARPATKKYRVVFFRDREQYVKELEKYVPGVEISTGFYSDKLELSFFYSSQGNPDLATWRHESTHQLFKETIRTTKSPFNASEIWLGEGIAMYFEGLYDFGDFVTLGGFDTQRLQYARLRALKDGQYLPFNKLKRLGQRELQTHPDVRQIYSQSAGIAQFLMTANGGRYREGLITYLDAIYGGKYYKSDAFNVWTGIWDAEIDREYREFLKVKRGQVERELIAPEAVAELALPQAELSEKDMARLGECTQLRWLDLSRAKIEGGVVRPLTGCQKLGELDLSGLKLSAEDFQALGELKALKILNLSGVEISEENFQVLAAIQSLEQLDLTGSQISQEWLSRLSQTRPKLKIVK